MDEKKGAGQYFAGMLTFGIGLLLYGTATLNFGVVLFSFIFSGMAGLVYYVSLRK
jgi:hypothetical protein